MTPALKIPMPRPPRLSMDDYLDFVETTIQESNPSLAARQKKLEKRVAKPFRITPPDPAAGTATGRPV